MKKIKIFMAISALLLITVIVFANKSRFSTYTLVAYDSSAHFYRQLTFGFTSLGVCLSTIGSNQVTVTGSSSTLPLFGFDGLNYYPLYTACF